MALELLRAEMVFRDVELLLAGVAGKLDDLHAVAQRPGDCVEGVGRRDEEHVGKIERHLDEVVAEGVVLLRIEHLEKRRRRVAAVVVAELIHLVKQHERILAARQLHRVDDAAGHRADIGFAVAANVALVPHAA